MKTNSKELKDVRRLLRHNATPAEAKLWSIIKNKQIGGLIFRRQFSIDHFILDFYCPSLHLAIELDGDYHFANMVRERDYNRDIILKEQYKIETLRFENKMVFLQPDVIVNSILSYMESRKNSSL
ncbi:MAG: DUF559 domain-containing protein [Bacteroidaceae bacterium]|nr:DUF559 domain-containing protein [Bacteroidaceae bacterium]